MSESSHSFAGGGLQASTGRSGRGCPCLRPAPGCAANLLCFPPTVTVASSEQNPVLIIVVVVIAVLTVLVSIVIGVMVWRR